MNTIISFIVRIQPIGQRYEEQLSLEFGMLNCPVSLPLLPPDISRPVSEQLYPGGGLDI